MRDPEDIKVGKAEVTIAATRPDSGTWLADGVVTYPIRQAKRTLTEIRLPFENARSPDEAIATTKEQLREIATAILA